MLKLAVVCICARLVVPGAVSRRSGRSAGARSRRRSRRRVRAASAHSRGIAAEAYGFL